MPNWVIKVVETYCSRAVGHVDIGGVDDSVSVCTRRGQEARHSCSYIVGIHLPRNQANTRIAAAGIFPSIEGRNPDIEITQ